MEILGNAILGRAFSRWSLSLTDKGLFRKVRVGDIPPQFIFLTDDPEKIVQLLDLNIETFNLELNDVFENLIDSPYIQLDMFLGYSDSKSFLLRVFCEFLHNNDFDSFCEPLRTERVEHILGIKYAHTVEEYKITMRGCHKNNFEAVKKELLSRGYDMRNMQNDLIKIKDEMGKFGFVNYLEHTPTEKVLELFSL